MHFFVGADHSAGKVSKGSERKREKLVSLVVWTTDIQRARLEKDLDADLRIISLLNFKSHLNIIISGKSKYVLMNEVTVHRRKNAATAKITMIKRYMHLWHVCLIMMNFLEGMLVIVFN